MSLPTLSRRRFHCSPLTLDPSIPSHPIPGSQRRIHCQTLQQTGYCNETQATLGGFPRSVRPHGPDERSHGGGIGYGDATANQLIAAELLFGFPCTPWERNQCRHAVKVQTPHPGRLGYLRWMSGSRIGAGYRASAVGCGHCERLTATSCTKRAMRAQNSDCSG